MSDAKEPCPLCLAAPADWVDDPHPKSAAIGDRLHRARTIIAALADLSESRKDRTVFGYGLHEWRHRGRQWLLNEDAN